jgi:hypothetical protein
MLQDDFLPLVNLCPLLVFGQFIAAAAGSTTTLLPTV